jgi:hypothetical protein
MTRTIHTRIIGAVFMGLATLAVASMPAEAQSRRAYCDSYARDVAGSRGNAGDVLAGTIGGALGGAIIGGIIDKGEGAGKGALIGGAAGTVLGAANAGSNWDRRYRRAYDDCMRSSASYRQPVYAGAPRPGTRAWIDYCASKYRSFNARTGTYTTYDGRQVPCR